MPKKQQKPKTKKPTEQDFIVFAFKNGGGIKTPITDVADGQQLLKKIKSSKSDLYHDDVRGLLLNRNELSHAYITKEIVQ